MVHRARIVLRVMIACGVFMLAIPALSFAQNVEIGRATALDGDTLILNDRIFQLVGVDAPELGQTCLEGKKRWRCGLTAGWTLQRLLCCRDVECSIRETERPAVDLAVCVSQSRDVGETMVLRGMAVAGDDLGPGYKSSQESARSARLGIWRGEFVQPADWRRGERLPSLPDEVVVFCEIKGVTNERDQKVFLVPGHPDYASTEIDADRGDRIFCSDDEARLAGWRSTR